MKREDDIIKTGEPSTREQKLAMIRECRYFAKGDIVVFAACILLVVIFTLLAFGAREEAGSSFEVISYGETIATLPLDEDAEYLYTVQNGKGSIVRVMVGEYYENFENGNLIRVEGGKVCVAEADCPDRTCVLMGQADSGELICMPHGLTIKITGGGLGSDA